MLLANQPRDGIRIPSSEELASSRPGIFPGTFNPYGVTPMIEDVPAAPTDSVDSWKLPDSFDLYGSRKR